MSAEVATRLNEHNLYSLYAFIARHGRRTFHEDDVSWVITKPSRWPNHIFNSQLRPETAVGEIEKIKAKIAAEQAPPFWLVSPRPKPHNLGQLLCDAGFTRVGRQFGMILHLQDFDRQIAEVPSGLDIEVVKTKANLGRWLAVVHEALFRQEALEPDLAQELLGHGGCVLYMGCVNGSPVATSARFVASGTVGLYLISVLPAFRHQGIGTAMAAATLADAKREGYRMAILQASEMGRGLYARLGFQEHGVFELFKLIERD